MRLFDAQFSQNNPAYVELLNEGLAKEVEARCVAFGITIERAEITQK
jgi:hypothetical protein